MFSLRREYSLQFHPFIQLHASMHCPPSPCLSCNRVYIQSPSLMKTSLFLNIARVTRSPLALSSESRRHPPSTITSFLANVHLSCNPSLNLRKLAFSDVSEDLASAYLSVLPNHERKGNANEHEEEMIVIPRPGPRRVSFL